MGAEPKRPFSGREVKVSNPPNLPVRGIARNFCFGATVKTGGTTAPGSAPLRKPN